MAWVPSNPKADFIPGYSENPAINARGVRRSFIPGYSENPAVNGVRRSFIPGYSENPAINSVFDDCPIRWNPDLQDCCPDGMLPIFDPAVGFFICQVPSVAVFFEGDTVAVKNQHGQLIPGVAYSVISVNPLGPTNPDRTYNVGLDGTDDVFAESLPASELNIAPISFLCNPDESFDPTPFIDNPGTAWDVVGDVTFSQAPCYFGPFVRARTKIDPITFGVSIIENWLVTQARNKILGEAVNQGLVPLFTRTYKNRDTGEYIIDLSVAVPLGTEVQASIGFLLSVALFTAFMAIVLPFLVHFTVLPLFQGSRGIAAHMEPAQPGSISDGTVVGPDGKIIPKGQTVPPGSSKWVPPVPPGKSPVEQLAGVLKILAWGAVAVGGAYLAVTLLPKELDRRAKKQAGGSFGGS